jgi:hypothetical protein
MTVPALALLMLFLAGDGPLVAAVQPAGFGATADAPLALAGLAVAEPVPAQPAPGAEQPADETETRSGGGAPVPTVRPAAGGPRTGVPSVNDREDALSEALRSNPALHAQARSGMWMNYGGKLLIVAGAAAIVGGYFVTVTEIMMAASQERRGKIGSTGPLLIFGGLGSVGGGIGLWVSGNQRRTAAASAWNHEHPDRPVKP